MTDSLKVRRIGNSLGIIMPKRISDHLRVKAGDTLTREVNAARPGERARLLVQTAAGGMVVFLQLNGRELTAEEANAVLTM